MALGITLGVTTVNAKLEVNQAKVLRSEGDQLRRKKKYHEAFEKYSRAYELEKSPTALAQMGLMAAGEGSWLVAERHLQGALQSSKHPWIRLNRQFLEESLRGVSRHLGFLEVSGGVEGAVVSVNGEHVGTLPLEHPIRVVTGQLALEVSAPGYLSVVYTIFIDGRNTAHEEVRLIPTPKAEEFFKKEPKPPLSARARRLRLGAGLGFAGTALFLASGIAGSVLREQAVARWNDDTACLIGGRTRAQNCQAHLDAAQTAQGLSITAYVLSGGLLATSIALLVLSNREPRESVLKPVVACGGAPTGIGCHVGFSF
jgi:hypothetical protein